MSELAMRHHVERSLRRDFDLGPLEPDDDGDYAVTSGGSLVWVRPMLDGEPPSVRVWSVAAVEVKPTKAVLSEINDVNLGIAGFRCFLTPYRTIVVAAEVEIESLVPGQLGRLANVVGEVARGTGEMITTVHGGERPFALVDDESADAELD